MGTRFQRAAPGLVPGGSAFASGAGPMTSLDQTDSDTFRRDLVEVMGPLRAFSRSLCRNHALADDLVQETLMKAWAARQSYRPGTNFKAWTYRILRNAFYSSWRKDRRLSQLNTDLHANTIHAVDSVEATLELADVSGAMRQLPAEQRQAIVLTAAGGCDYEQAASIAGVAIGTIKSRVSRGRSALSGLLDQPLNRRGRGSAVGGVEAMMRDAMAMSGQSV